MYVFLTKKLRKCVERVGKERKVEEVREENDIYIGIIPVSFYL